MKNEIISEFYTVRLLEQAPKWLEVAEKWAVILTAVFAAFAVFEYWRNKKNDRILSVVGQIAFFREQLMLKNQEMIDYVQLQDPKYVFARVTLEKASLKEVLKNQKTEAFRQDELLKKDKKIPVLQTEVLNLLEEFSLRVIYSSTAKHPALIGSIRPAFIPIVETLSIPLLVQREMLMGNGIYSGILNLYKIWNKDMDRRSKEERSQEVFETIAEEEK